MFPYDSTSSPTSPQRHDNSMGAGYSENVNLSREELMRLNRELQYELAELKAEHEQQTEILESIGDIFYAVDENFNFTYINQKAEQVWKRKREELIGKHYWTEFPRLLGSETYQMHQKALSERKPVHYQTLSTLVGRWIDVSIYPRNTGGLSVYLHDIHERKVAEDALFKSEERLRIAIEAAGLGTWDWNLLTDEIQWNERHYELFGLTPEDKPMHPSDFFHYVHPKDKEMVGNKLTAAIKERHVFEAEFRAILPNGFTRWMCGYGRVVEEIDGEAARMCGVMFDSTQRKLAVEMLHDSEERFSTIVNQATASVIELDLKGQFTFANQTFCRAVDYTETELLNMNWQNVTHPDDLPHCKELLEKAMSGGETFVTEKRVLRKDGTQRWMNESVSSIRDAENTPQSVVAVLIDITERKRIEDALRKSEEQYRAIIDQASVGIVQCDLQGNIQVVNDRLADMLGYTTEELLRTRVQDMTHDEDVPFAMEAFVQAVMAGVPLEVEKRCIRRDGSRLWVSASISAIRNEEGIPQAASVILVDITKRQEAEEKLRHAHDELELRVRERTQELAQALEHVREEIAQRKQAEAGRDQLLRKVVHAQEEERRRLSRELHDNLGQHLTAILMAIQAIESQNQSKNVNINSPVLGNLARLRGMVDELLNVSHRLAWEIRPALLDNIGLKAALEQFVINWSEKSGIKADFVGRIPKEKTPLSPEAKTALFRVAQEALTNVQRHSGASQVSVVLEQNEDSVAIIVEDNGRGFDLQNNDYSTRLGLMGMQERLELVGGTLTLESSENSGLTVYARVALSQK